MLEFYRFIVINVKKFCYSLKIDSCWSASSSLTMVYSLAFFRASMALWLFSSSIWPPGGKFGKTVVGNKSRAFLKHEMKIKSPFTFFVFLQKKKLQVYEPIVKEQIFHVSHVHRVKFINAEYFKKFFHRCHTVATSQINFWVISDEW